MILIGLSILAIHLFTTFSSTQMPPECRVQLRPWFTHIETCSVIRIDCSAADFQGHDDDVTANMNRFDVSMALSLTFANCPELMIPPRLQALQSLRRHDIYNSTLRAWPAESALTEASHPDVSTVVLVRVRNIPSFPEGPMHPRFPRQLQQIYVCDSGLEALSDGRIRVALPDACDRARSLPANVSTSVALSESDCFAPLLSVASNHVASVSDDLVAITPGGALSLAGNPIAHLPPTGFITERLSLDLSDTAIRVLPEWLARHSPRIIAAATRYVSILSRSGLPTPALRSWASH